MGLRLVQRRRPQLDGRLPGTTFQRGRSVPRCGLFRARYRLVREGFPRRPKPCFHETFDSQKRLRRSVAAAAFSGSGYRPVGTKTPKIVVGMQHTLTTFLEMVRTPKKSAHACLFCFTIATSQTTV
jgi:hypothetical protein